MSELTLGLAAIGMAVVAAVLVYNYTQERRARREAQRVFGSTHADALLDEVPSTEIHSAKPSRKAEMRASDMPDGRLDYVIELEIGRGTLSATVVEHWRPVEQRFAHRALIAGADGDGWRRLAVGDVRSLTALRAALQMVSRSGVVGDTELVEFRSEVETLAAALGARVSAPEMRGELDKARTLDALCSETDIQVALHVAGSTVGQGLPDGEHEFRVEPQADRVSFILDVPRSLQPARAFESMARAARQLADAGGGRLVDDNGNLLDERALRAIEAELEAVRTRLADAGVEPGSELALRLFS
jgi:hypothetical protein